MSSVYRYSYKCKQRHSSIITKDALPDADADAVITSTSHEIIAKDEWSTISSKKSSVENLSLVQWKSKLGRLA